MTPDPIALGRFLALIVDATWRALAATGGHDAVAACMVAFYDEMDSRLAAYLGPGVDE